MAVRYTPVNTYQPIFKQVAPVQTMYDEMPPDMDGWMDGWMD